MEQIVVCGGRPLNGRVRIGGAKNAALPIMAASIMVRGAVLLHRVPRLSDVDMMARILRALGVTVEWVGPDKLLLVPQDDGTTEAPAELVRQMRGSICVLGPLMATRGRAALPLPGGCVLGPRPVDLHVQALRTLGAQIDDSRSRIEGHAPRLHGSRLNMAGPYGSSALGTANALMAAALAEGRTVIEYAAREPEIQDLARFLIACGARIQGVGTGVLTVDGVEHLTGTEHALIPDRIEAGTFLAAGVATGGCLTVDDVRVEHLTAILNVLHAMGASTEVGTDTVTINRAGPIQPTDFVTGTYPGVPTDMQPQLGAVLCHAQGVSAVSEGVHPQRFTHVPELTRMGARIAVGEAYAEVYGGERLHGACVTAADLRAGAALVVAGLAADGISTVSGIDQIDRGYEELDVKLASLGAEIRRQGAAQDRPAVRKIA